MAGGQGALASFVKSGMTREAPLNVAWREGKEIRAAWPQNWTVLHDRFF